MNEPPPTASPVVTGDPPTASGPPGNGTAGAAAARVSGLTCPNCGGALEVDAGLRVITCPYCATPLLATSEVGVRRLAVEPKVDAEVARQAARRWLSRGWDKDSRLRREAKVGEAFLSFLPFFRVEADCVGVALGTERRTRSVGSGKSRRTETYEVDVERRVERSFDRTFPALNVAEWGVQRVDLRGDVLVPYDGQVLERRGMVFAPTGSEADLRQAVREQIMREADPAAGLQRVGFRFLETLRERLTVIYYPLWVVRYGFRERSYQVLIDADDGSLAYGKAAGNDLYRALMLVGTQAAALFVGTTLLQLWEGGLESLLFVGVGVATVVYWGWRRFRYGGVVIEGSGTRAETGLGESLQSLAAPQARDRILADLKAGRLPRIER